MNTHPPTAGTTSAGYPDAILRVLSTSPDREVLIASDGRRITARTLRDDTYRLARALHQRGVGRGVSVALLSGNTPEAIQARYAITLAGARLVSLYETTDPTALAAFLDGADCALLLVDSTRNDTAKALLPLIERTTVCGLGTDEPGEDLLASATEYPTGPFAAAVRPEEDWSVVSTGGTTGGPRGVRIAHAAYNTMLAVPVPGLGTPPRLLVCTGFVSSTGALTDLTLLQGGTVILQPSFNPRGLLTAIEQERVTVMWLPPPLLRHLLDEPSLPTTNVSSLTRIMYGGCTASTSLLRRAIKVFGPILQGCYGQTEAGPISSLLPHEHADDLADRDGAVSVGWPLPGVEVCVRDRNGEPLEHGQEGEIWVRSPIVMSGYWKDDGLTREVLHPDGWLRTGDLGRFDERGNLSVLDRLTDTLFVSGGDRLVRVHPADLEELLAAHPSISECAVFAASGADLREEIHLAVVPTAGSRVDLEEIGAFLTKQKGAHCAPAALHTLTSLPLTPRGKPDKRALRNSLGLATSRQPDHSATR
ncbi:class I adenylate-forming enzyme family protein [Streptomyces blastmyceticus]|uniref:AMP-binding protein n=1 Tax=Streptomyces blastmyceticus TaxID=68180 RepID=A0ABP3GNC8_9ACTN